MSEKPLVSAIMLVYNREHYLPESVESVLKQTYDNFELIIVNDSRSNALTNQILADYAQRDSRIRIFTQTTTGLTAARHMGWRLASGKYIAWVDSDDICLPDKFAKQVECLKKNPDYGICGTWIRTIGTSKSQVLKFPTQDSTIRCRLLFYSVLANPTVMMRTALFSEYGLDYDLSCINGEDYDLWTRAILLTKFTNLPEVLVLYRYHSSQTIQVDQERIIGYVEHIQAAQLRRLGLNPTPEELEIHLCLGVKKVRPHIKLLRDANLWLHKLEAANRAIGLYPEPEFSRVLQERWISLCINDGVRGIPHILRFLPSVVGSPLRLFEVGIRRLGKLI